MKDYEYKFVEDLKTNNTKPDYITIDIAHGHSESVINMVKHIKKAFRNFDPNEPTIKNLVSKWNPL